MWKDFSLKDIEHSANVIIWDGKNKHFVWDDNDFKNCILNLDASPPPELMDFILEKVGIQAKETSKVELPFDKIALPMKDWWHTSSEGELRVPIGRAGARKIQYLELGRGMAHHCLVVGRIGAGKSTLLHVLITALGLIYSPDEVELYLVDFKKGVEFKTYATHNMPHARVVAIESEREFGLSVIQGLDADLRRRGELFRSVGVDHISNYRRKTSKLLPRIVLLVDEFQEFFVEDDAIASKASQILDRIVRQGRAFGIHVILSSQTLAGAYTLPRSTIDQIAVRIALQCSEADSRLILSEDNQAARLLSRSGEAIYNAANGLVEGNNLFQVAWLPEEKRDVYLQHIQNKAIEQKVPPQSQIVFEGYTLAEPIKNCMLYDLLMAFPRIPVLKKMPVWLGEPIAIKEPTTAYFKRQRGNNLLIIGQNDTAAAGMLLSSLIALASQYRQKEAHFYIMNLSSIESPHTNLFTKLPTILPHSVQLIGQRDFPKLLDKIAENINERMKTETDTGANWNGSSLYVVIFGLQRARDLNQEDEFSYESPHEGKVVHVSPTRQLATILTEGPDVGVHTLVWCDSYNNLTRRTGRQLLREFDMRVALQMSAEDSNNLINSPAASKLGPYRALYLSEEEGGLEKFQPYGLPTGDWLAWIEQRFRTKGI